MGGALGYDTVLGMALGAASVWYLWNWIEDSSTGSSVKAPSNKKISEEDLKNFTGLNGRSCYVATPSGKVFDVTKDVAKFPGQGGTVIEKELDNSDYQQVGNLIVKRNFTKAELAAFDGKDGRPVYVCAKGIVYDVDPEFYGPEGPYEILAGRDATRALALVSLDIADVENTSIEGLSWSDLNTLEEWIAKFEMKYDVVGYLVDKHNANDVVVNKQNLPSFLTKDRQKVQLSEKIELSHDTRLFRFGLPESEMRLGLPTGKHIKFWCPNPKPVKDGEWNGQKDAEFGKDEIERKYTPASSDDDIGHFDVVIKVYKGGVLDRFPDGGKMSLYLDSLNIGDTMDVAGPYGLIEYKGKGVFNIKRKDITYKHVGMMAGGTGITPMLQLITTVLKDENDDTKLSLIFANQTEEDILVRDMLEVLADKHPQRFKLWYTVDRPPENWKYSQGFITEDMIRMHLPPPSDDCVILMCGPPPMIKFACKANLDKLGYAKHAQVEF